jgi:hypothetical protein
MQHCIKFLLVHILYEAQHVSGDTPPIIRSLKLHWQPLVLHTWKVVGRMVAGRCPAASAVLGSWWWAVCLETCWASYKIWTNKNLIHCCILLDFLWIVLWCTDSGTSNIPICAQTLFH